jgi:hypothetical protein
MQGQSESTSMITAAPALKATTTASVTTATVAATGTAASAVGGVDTAKLAVTGVDDKQIKGDSPVPPVTGRSNG